MHINKTEHLKFERLRIFFQTPELLLASMAKPVSIEVWNPCGKYRVVSTKPMPGTRWIDLLVQQDCRVEVIFLIIVCIFLG